jgi:Bifunctional DNA primase/polymerase, N-terminal
MNVLEAALAYARQGHAVLPCAFGTKEPAIKRGFYSATTNPETIRRLFGGTRPYNIAVRTGMASRAWVLDMDNRHGGFDSLRDLEALYGPLPLTRQCRTADGIHFWWRATCPIQCSEDRVGRGLGVKADGGCAMVPPSVHPQGPIYTWENDAPLAVAPDWLVRLTRKPPPPRITLPPRNHNGPPGAYGAVALEREIEALAGTAPGNRNHALNRASFSLHQLVGGGELDASHVERELLTAAERNGLMADPNDGPRKVIATIRSGARAGLQHPRSRP